MTRCHVAQSYERVPLFGYPLAPRGELAPLGYKEPEALSCLASLDMQPWRTSKLLSPYFVVKEHPGVIPAFGPTLSARPVGGLEVEPMPFRGLAFPCRPRWPCHSRGPGGASGPCGAGLLRMPPWSGIRYPNGFSGGPCRGGGRIFGKRGCGGEGGEGGGKGDGLEGGGLEGEGWPDKLESGIRSY